jgi:hypothetical protein
MSGILLVIFGVGLVSLVATILGNSMRGVGKGRQYSASSSSSDFSGWWAYIQDGHDVGAWDGDGGGCGGGEGGGEGG